jgi:hypothetical protein
MKTASYAHCLFYSISHRISPVFHGKKTHVTAQTECLEGALRSASAFDLGGSSYEMEIWCFRIYPSGGLVHVFGRLLVLSNKLTTNIWHQQFGTNREWFSRRNRGAIWGVRRQLSITAMKSIENSQLSAYYSIHHKMESLYISSHESRAIPLYPIS